jgi:hypothetical protein
LTTTSEMSPTVSAVTLTKARVRRAWNVRGSSRRAGRRIEPPERERRSALGEGIADPSVGQHELGLGRIVLDLVPQVADMDVDGFLVLVERLVVPEELEQLAPREDPPRPAGEMAQDLELRRGQRDVAIPPSARSP